MQTWFHEQGPSPDEVALVEGGRLLGFEFVRRDRASLTVCMQGHEASHFSLSHQPTTLL